MDKKETCGHINRHSRGLKKELDNIACVKPIGHSGDHEGDHEELEKEYDTQIVNGVETTKVLLVAKKRTVQWGDMAGVPAADIPAPEPVKPLTLMDMDKRVLELERGK